MILNEHPVSYLDEVHAQLAALLDNGPWSAWKHRPGGAYLLRADRMPEGERVLLAAVARAVLDDERGPLAHQLDHHTRPPPEDAETLLRTRPVRRPSTQPAAPPLSFANGTGGFAEGGREYVDRPRGRPGDAAALGQRHREPPVRDDRHRLRVGVHLVREQPGEPAHAVRERSGERSHRRGHPRARRRDRRGVVADARARSRGRRRAVAS